MTPTLAELEADPHAALAALREREGPVAWVPALNAWIVLTRERALRAMRDDAGFTVDDPRFTTARVVGRSMLSTDGDEHARHRAPFAAAWRRRAVLEGLRGFVESESVRLAGSLREGDDLRTRFAGPLAAAVMRRALGLEVGVDAMLRWYRAIVAAVTELTAGRDADLPEAIRGDMRAAGVGPDEAVLLFGGIETTEGMIANALWHLLTHPDQLALLCAEPELLPNAVEESLRLEPAAAVVDRYATRDAPPIRAGDLVTISIAAANRDPAVFADPDRFDVRRPNAKLHLAFAHGPHVCLGMHLARLEAHTAVRVLFERHPRLRVAERAEPPRGLVFRKPPSLRAALR